MRPIYTYLGIALFASGFLTVSSKSEPTGRTYTSEDAGGVQIEQWKRREIQIFGAVVDQSGDPVGGAEVLLHWQEFSTPFPGPISKKWIKADEQGLWEFKQRAMRATVREARRDGYVFSMKQQDFGGISSDDLKNNRTDSTNRIVVRLHKSVGLVFLVMDEGELAEVSDSCSVAKGFDLYRRKTLSIVEATNQPPAEFYSDLEIRIASDASNHAWQIVFRTTGVGDGLIVTNALLFEAPAEGYVSECILNGVDNQDFPRYLYLRSRTPPLYTRFDMGYFLRPDSCLVAYDLVANPYGTRSFEPNSDLEPLWQLREQLTEEARVEISAGRRLNREDLQKRIRKEQGAITP